jgi:hypothetical protein
VVDDKLTCLYVVSWSGKIVACFEIQEKEALKTFEWESVLVKTFALIVDHPHDCQP